MAKDQIKQEVRRFYDQVGWQKESSGWYQNARYEDLREVSREYIHKCHLRINRHILRKGDFILDAGSGPVQYPEYLTYSEGYKYRVCMDLSINALKEARNRLGEKGLYVIGDIVHLPFMKEGFDGIVSLHTIHHVPIGEKVATYIGLYNCLKHGKSMVTVDGWTHVPIEPIMDIIVRIVSKLRKWFVKNEIQDDINTSSIQDTKESIKTKTGTFVLKTDARWFKKEFKNKLPFKILVWRSVSVKFLRGAIHPKLGGKWWLKLLYLMEELFPRILGEKGQYPLIVFTKRM